jgi:aspartyl/glutamyl-tRNA(Asn/Gln) amidotransferase C subunit
MAIREGDVLHVARLARIRLSPEEVRLYQDQLGRVLDHMKELEALGAEAPAPREGSAPLREDAVEDRPWGEALAAIAPEVDRGCFKVPKVIVTLLLGLCLAPAAQAKKPGPQALEVLRRGVIAYEEARFDEAVDLLSQAMDLESGWGTAAAYRAMALWTSGDLDGARRDAKLGMGLRPADAQSYAARGLARFVGKQLEPAAKDFVRAAKLDPQCSMAFFGMGSVRSTQQRPQDALANLNIAVKLSPRSAVAYIVRGTVQEKLKQYSKAVADYTKVLQISPHFVWAYYYRGRAQRELKQYPKAIEDLTQFLGRVPDFEDALYSRSNAYYLTGAFKEALRDLDRVISLNPKNGLAYANRGLARGETGDREGALQDLRKAKEFLPADKAERIQAQIDGIEAGARMPQSPPKTEITGTPGKGLEPPEEVEEPAPKPRGQAPQEPLPDEAPPETKGDVLFIK